MREKITRTMASRRQCDGRFLSKLFGMKVTQQVVWSFTLIKTSCNWKCRGSNGAYVYPAKNVTKGQRDRVNVMVWMGCISPNISRNRNKFPWNRNRDAIIFIWKISWEWQRFCSGVSVSQHRIKMYRNQYPWCAVISKTTEYILYTLIERLLDEIF